jgi:hypothetical protein
MSTREIILTLPESLAGEAEAQGLLNPEAVERMLRTELRQRRIEKLFSAADRLAAVDLAPLTEAEVQAEIEIARRERRAADGRGG